VKGRGETLKLNKYFVERITINSNGPIQKHYQLTEGYYLRTMLLTNKGSHFQKLISTRYPSIDSGLNQNHYRGYPMPYISIGPSNTSSTLQLRSCLSVIPLLLSRKKKLFFTWKPIKKLFKLLQEHLGHHGYKR
jgi:hypothetical protein